MILENFKQDLLENGYFRQEELIFADCDRYQRARISGLLNKAAHPGCRPAPPGLPACRRL